jgi:hypothetical protein
VKAKEDNKRASDIEADAPNDGKSLADDGDTSSSDSHVSKASQSKKPKNDKPDATSAGAVLISSAEEDEVGKVLD